MSREEIHEAIVFVLLVSIAVAGRWAQPTWSFTPLAAVAALGGFYFSRTSMALLLPVSALFLSNWLLPGYGNWPVFAAVVAMVLLPVALGRITRRTSGWQRALAVASCGCGPAAAFFLVTNLSVWACTGMYERSLSGLMACYAAGIPFYRTMLCGDLFYAAIFAGSLYALRRFVPSQDSRHQCAFQGQS